MRKSCCYGKISSNFTHRFRGKKSTQFLCTCLTRDNWQTITFSESNSKTTFQLFSLLNPYVETAITTIVVGLASFMSFQTMHLNVTTSHMYKLQEYNQSHQLSLKRSSIGQVDESNASGYDIAVMTLTLPPWIFITVFLLFILVHYIRNLQYFSLYDRCSWRNAHFCYGFHIVFGKHSSKFTITNDTFVIIDLLDNQLVSTMTIQIPSTSIFNDKQLFLYRHTRPNIRCLNFSVYRKHPIKDFKTIRVAHNCNDQDARIFVYGIDVHDSANAENKFFPVSSIIKYRGTSWALNTTFDLNKDASLSKIGCDCSDPFSCSCWPTYIEILVFIFSIWCSTFFFGSIVPVASFNKVLHSSIIGLIVGFLSLGLAVSYLKFVKRRSGDHHNESSQSGLMKLVTIFSLIILSVILWSFSLSTRNYSRIDAETWASSTTAAAMVLSSISLSILLIMRWRKSRNDSTLLEETDARLWRTNSLLNIEFIADDGSKRPLPHLAPTQQTQQTQQIQATVGKSVSKSSKAIQKSLNNNSKDREQRRELLVVKKTSESNRRGGANHEQKDAIDNDQRMTKSAYMKTKNRNSISQYV